MNKLKTIIFTAVITILLVVVGYLVSLQIPKPIKQGSAPTGSIAISGSSSIVTLPSHTSLQIFASSTCISRTISLSATSSILFTLVDQATNPPTGAGHIQNASTTIAYDSGIYGCGLWRAYNPSQNQLTFTISEFGGFQ